MKRVTVKKRFQEIVNAAQDSLVVVDDQWRVKAVNQTAETMFGCGSYDLIGQSLKELLLPWSQSPADLNDFLDKNRDGHSIFLTLPGVPGERKPPVQMRFGAELE